MASVDSQMIEEVTAHAQSDSLEDARQMCADGTYFPNNLRIFFFSNVCFQYSLCKGKVKVIPLQDRCGSEGG